MQAMKIKIAKNKHVSTIIFHVIEYFDDGTFLKTYQPKNILTFKI